MLHELSVVQIAKMLRNLEGWIDKGVALADGSIERRACHAGSFCGLC